MMKIRQRVTLIILRDEKLLLIRRTRDGRTFTVLPGGGVEDGETLTAAAMREALEETSLAVSLGPILWTRPITTSVSNGDTFEQVETAYLITEFSGTPKLNLAEFPHHSPDNLYELEWVNVSDVPDTAVYPGPLPTAIIQTIANKKAA